MIFFGTKIIKIWRGLLLMCRGCPYNLFSSILTSPEAIPKWSLFPLSPNPLLSLMMVLLLLLLFSLLHLFLQKSSLQHFKEPLINWLSLLLKLVCVDECMYYELVWMNECTLCEWECVCVGGGGIVATELTTIMVDKLLLLAHLSEFSPCLLFGVLLQYLTYLFFTTTSSHIQGC